MKYLLTGASGFLGKHILEALPRESVVTLGRREENQIICDLSTTVPDLSPVDVVIHCAGKAHIVPKSAEEERDFFQVNLEGTRHLIQAIEKSGRLPRQLVFISTVSVYGKDFGISISEDHPLLGSSPYAQSKILAESLVQNWGKSRNIPVLILRLPLVVGTQPPGNLGRMIKGIQTGLYASIAGGKARKSMVLADDVANLIARVIGQEGVYHLTDGYHPSFNELESAISEQLNTKVKLKLPMAFAKMIAKVGDIFPFFPVNSQIINKICLDLTFDDSKAKVDLKWLPNKVLNFRILP